MSQLRHHRMQHHGDTSGVVTVARSVRIADAGRVYGYRLKTSRGQRTHNMAPGIPGLRPSGDQQDWLPFPCDNAVDTLSVYLRIDVLRPGILFQDLVIWLFHGGLPVILPLSECRVMY